jgi:hypothetical protein
VLTQASAPLCRLVVAVTSGINYFTFYCIDCDYCIPYTRTVSSGLVSLNPPTECEADSTPYMDRIKMDRPEYDNDDENASSAPQTEGPTTD